MSPEDQLTAALARHDVKANHTPPRSIRVATPLWVAAQAKAAERGETVTDVLVRALERYVKEK